MAETTQFNMRVDADNATAFRKYCEELGMSQAQGFGHIMSIVELDKEKKAIPSREKELEEFETHAHTLIDMYLNSIKMNENAEERVKEQFKTELGTKDKAIADYQRQVEELKEKLKDSQKELKEKENSLKLADNLAGKFDKERRSAEELADSMKELNKTLEARINEISAKAEEYDKLQKSFSDVSNQLTREKNEKEKLKANFDNASERLTQQNTILERTLSERNELRKSVNDLNIEIAGLRKDIEKAVSDTKKDAEIEKEKAVSSIREEYNEKIMKIREEKAVLESQVKHMEERITASK